MPTDEDYAEVKPMTHKKKPKTNKKKNKEEL